MKIHGVQGLAPARRRHDCRQATTANGVGGSPAEGGYFLKNIKGSFYSRGSPSNKKTAAIRVPMISAIVASAIRLPR